MLQPLLEILGTQRIVLASGSPRRHEILKKIGLKFEVIPSTFEENLDKSSFKHARDYVKENAKQKALEVSKRLAWPNRPDLVIGTDTVVVLDECILEKPRDKDNAFQMLKSLSGCSHKVLSGVALVQCSSHPDKAGNEEESAFALTQFHEETVVTFGDLTEQVIEGYIKTGEPMDKAGAYGIQGIGGSLVKGIQGDYYNVMGFPLYHFCLQMTNLYSKGEGCK